MSVLAHSRRLPVTCPCCPRAPSLLRTIWLSRPYLVRYRKGLAPERPCWGDTKSPLVRNALCGPKQSSRQSDGTPWVKFDEGGYPILSPVTEVGKMVTWTGRQEWLRDSLYQWHQYTVSLDRDNHLRGDCTHPECRPAQAERSVIANVGREHGRITARIVVRAPPAPRQSCWTHDRNPLASEGAVRTCTNAPGGPLPNVDTRLDQFGGF